MRLPEKGIPEEQVRSHLRSMEERDFRFGSGRVLGSMCTAPSPLANEAHARFLSQNLGDPAMCPGSVELEREAGEMILDLVSAPHGASATFLSGGSEANVIALALARRPDRDEIVLPRSAHFSFEKAARILGMRLRYADLLPDYTVNVARVRSLVSHRTACLVGVAGATELGTVDDIPALSALARELDLPLHVDAAFGGFVIPFARRLGRTLPAFDFSLPGVSTVTIDPHKMGGAGIPCGVLAARRGEALREMTVPTPYLSGEGHVTLVGTRSAAGPASAYAALASLGVWGYMERVRECLDNTERLSRGVRESGATLAIEPVLNLVVVRVASPERVRARMYERGFVVNVAPLASGIRLVVMPHVTRAAVDAFLPEFVAALKEEGEIGG